jgi:undecaprenyl-diphosphatase
VTNLEFLQIAILALIQGITEFLPISSSAHLLLPHHVLNWDDQGLAFDTAVHLGSLVAVLIYFRLDISTLAAAMLKATITRQHSEESRFALFLGVASIPVLVAGYVGRSFVEANLRNLEVIIATTVIFAVVLLIADLKGSRTRHDHSLDLKSALFIGLSQCLALVPGTSRSGITMTTALLMGFTRESASRISFMIAIPAIAGACFLKVLDLATGDQAVDWIAMLAGGVIAAVSAYFCIRLFLDLIDRIGFMPFIAYRLILGAVLFFLVLY